MRNMFTRGKGDFYVYYCLCVEMSRHVHDSQNQIFQPNGIKGFSSEYAKTV